VVQQLAANNAATTVIDSGSAVDLTTADKTFLSTPNPLIPSVWYKTDRGTNVFNWAPFRCINKTLPNGINTNRTVRHHPWVDGVGKFSWTHNPANGDRYNITTSRGVCSPTWRWLVTYQQRTDNMTCPPEPDCTPKNYTGTCKVKRKCYYANHTEGSCKSSCSGSTKKVQKYSYDIEVCGLKPNTVHEFRNEGRDHSGKCVPKGGAYADQIKSDSSGKCEFEYKAGVVADKVKSGKKDKCELKAPNSYASFQTDNEG
jgi:hypothetical protein